jgi:lipopolysaccharide/colanic/teichoic acid biosynthesis glycosyltransferase
MLVPAAPVMLVLAIAVRLSSPGPILFRQLRTGQHGRSFEPPSARRADGPGAQVHDARGDTPANDLISTDKRR